MSAGMIQPGLDPKRLAALAETARTAKLLREDAPAK
jgi:hypothetical protein